MTGSGLSLFVTDRSADALMAVSSVSLLLAGFASVVALVTVAVLEIVEPWGSLALPLTTSVKVAVARAAKVASVKETTPVPPAGGAEKRVKAGPVLCVAETKVVPAGTASFRVTPWASLNPALVTVMV